MWIRGSLVGNFLYYEHMFDKRFKICKHVYVNMIDSEFVTGHVFASDVAAWANLHVPVLNSGEWFVRTKHEGLVELERIRRELDAATASLISTMPDSRDNVANISRITGASNCEAHKRVRVAKVCRALPDCLSLLGAGAISFEHALALAPVIDRPGVAALLEDACSQTPEEFRDTVAFFRLADESGEQLEKRQRALRSVRISNRPDGMISLAGVLPPIEGMTLKATLEAIMDAKWRQDHPERATKLGEHGGDTHEQRMCDALLSLIGSTTVTTRTTPNPTETPVQSRAQPAPPTNDPERATVSSLIDSTGVRFVRHLAPVQPTIDTSKPATPNPPGSKSSSLKPMVVIVFNVERWQAELDGHGPIPVSASLFDMAKSDLYYSFVNMKGEILKFGRARKDPSPLQRLAVVARDRQCTYAGCTAPASRCEIHHFNEWLLDQGFTDVEVLGLLCKSHHRHVHTNDLKATRQPDGAVHIHQRTTGRLVALARKS